MESIKFNEQIDNSSCFDCFKPLEQVLSVVCEKIKEFTTWFFSLFQCQTRSEEPTIVRIVSYNAGRVGDYQVSRSLREICNGIFPQTKSEIKDAFQRLLKTEETEKTKENLSPKEKAKAIKEATEAIKIEKVKIAQDQKIELKNTIEKIVQKGAQILCLQEVEKTQFRTENSILPPNFSSVIYGEDCAVAWNNSIYEIIGYYSTFRDENDSFCVSVDLRNIQTNKIIRVASYHLCGYNLEDARNNIQKNLPSENLELPVRCLNSTLEALKVCPRVKPDAIILGMDSNATPETSPRHFRAIQEKGFIFDYSDKTPTIVNASLCEAVKLDYLIATPLNGSTIEIEKYIPITKENGDEWSLWDKENPSDHLPIGATVIIK